MPEIDGRKQLDIKNHIRKTAAVYTPEWRFDEENPDVGTALALIYAEMFADTIQRFNQVPEKNKVAFFNGMNARLLPAIPATGYVTFDLAGNQTKGVPVKQKTQLIANVEDKEVGSVIFETAQDVYVTPGAVEEILCLSGRQDRILQVYDRRDKERAAEPYYLFDLNGINLQEHVLYFGQAGALYIKGGAWVEVELFSHYENRVKEEILTGFLNEKNALWEYGSEEGYLPFEGAKVQDGKLLFFKSERQPAFALLSQNKLESCWIRCSVKNIEPFVDLFLDKIQVTSQSRGILPEVINGAGVDENIHECFPFGEKMSLYSDVYFASQETLSKKGALIKLSFNLNFMRIPIDLDLGDPSINWKLIMRRSDFRPDVEYDITIEEVIWEYYNGRGWARLFPENAYRDVFTTQQGTMGQYRSIDFICPEDMSKILINSCESYYIRCRILKLNNLYKMKGHYISPYIEGPSFSYEYEQGGVLPDGLYTRNNLEEETYTAGDLRDAGKFFQPFKNIAEQRTALHLGFSQPLEDGPIKLLFFLGDVIADKPPRLAWEYYGRQGWTPLNVVDETENLRKTGIVTFMGNRDFQRARFWAREYYWIRLVDVEEGYNDLRTPRQLPRVKRLALNATQVDHLNSRKEELFFVELQAEDLVCQLLHPRVQEIQVWVDELGQKEEPQWEQWVREGRLKLVRDVEGALQKAWVRWDEVEDLALAGPEDRHYFVDRNLGRVVFGNGKNGRIPSAQERESVRISYSTGGGEIGNLQPGAVQRANVSIGFVNKVQNPEVVSGGCDQETVREALVRTAAALRHGYRGVTASDYEALALEASRNIWKAKCFANYNEQGMREPGSVTLAILQKDFQQGRDFFSNLRDQVYQYIAARISSNIVDLERFYVTEPQFLELSVKVELAVRDFSQVFAVKEAVESRLKAFINPMSGNFDGQGWEIGYIPNRTQILNSLKAIPGISFFKNVLVSAFVEGRFGRMEADLEQSGDLIFALPLSGEHEIIITVEERG